MNLLWTSATMVEAMDGRPLGTLPEGVRGISIDTRTLAPGDAFFAIKGEHSDGHDHATAAMAAGAGLLVVAEKKLPALGRLQVPMIVVDDVLHGLEQLGVAARQRTRAQIVAVTGSAGKTTTKEMLRSALAPSGNVHASVRSFNNHWGVPLTLARMPEDADFGIFEIGMNHAGEIRDLVKFVRPHIAIITLIAAAHLGYFKNIKEIADAKSEIFEGIVPGGYAVLNRDDALYAHMNRKAHAAGIDHVLGFGEHAKSSFKLSECVLHGGRSMFMAKIDGQDVAVKLGVPGRHMVQNCLAVLGAVHLAGGDLAKAALALANFSTAKGRGDVHKLKFGRGSITLVDESYNANPASMEAAIKVLAATPVAKRGRRIAVLGDMLELGDHSQELHAQMADILTGNSINMAFLAGPEMKALADAAGGEMPIQYRSTVDELLPVLMNAVRGGDALMVKSSNGSGFSKIVDAFVKKFQPAAGA